MATTLDYVKAQLPDYADTYVKDMLSRTQAYTDVNANPYQQYTGNRVAGFSDLQKQAFTNAATMAPSQYGTQGAGIAGLAAQQALAAGDNFRPAQFQNQYQSQAPYQAERTGSFYQGQSPYQYQQAQNQFRDPGQYREGRISTERFGQPQADMYMSPFMQSVVERQQQDAQRQADVATTQRNANAVKAGAFGGSRQAIERSEAARNLAEQKGDIQAQGLQNAFQQAQAQFNADQARGLTAQQATEQSRQFGAGQGLQAAGLGAQYGLAANQLNSQQQQFGANLGLQNAQNAAQYGLAGSTLSQADRQFAQSQGLQNAQNLATYGAQAAQLGEQSRQYGAGLGLQGANTALQGATALGNLGNQQYQQNLGITGLQSTLGGLQQANTQAQTDTDYQNFMAAQMYPQQMLSFQSNMLNGLPMAGSAGSVTMPESPNYGNAILGGIFGLASKYIAKGGAIKDDGEPGLMALAASKYA